MGEQRRVIGFAGRLAIAERPVDEQADAEFGLLFRVAEIEQAHTQELQRFGGCWVAEPEGLAQPVSTAV